MGDVTNRRNGGRGKAVPAKPKARGAAAGGRKSTRQVCEPTLAADTAAVTTQILVEAGVVVAVPAPAETAPVADRPAAKHRGRRRKADMPPPPPHVELGPRQPVPREDLTADYVVEPQKKTEIQANAAAKAVVAKAEQEEKKKKRE